MNAFLTLCILIGGVAWYVSDRDKPTFSQSDISSIRKRTRRLSRRLPSLNGRQLLLRCHKAAGAI